MTDREGEGMGITRELRYVADRIDERFSRELTAKQDEVDALQAKLDVSMPVPLDADGVPCHIGDEIQPIGMRSFEVKKIIYNGRQKQEMVGPNGAGEYYFADICHHVAPEQPETIEADAERWSREASYLVRRFFALVDGEGE